jgi:hypothetical protein
VNDITDSSSIVFVHGFTGHPEETWTQRKVDSRLFESSESRKDQPKMWEPVANAFHKSHCVFWPRDLVQHSVPNSRVLTFGYDTHVKHRLAGNLNKSTVYDIAGDFLASLEANRRGDPSRPMLFVAHSLGGIVVKETLRRSNQAPQNHLRTVCESTIGIIFFGTPHSGANPRNILCSIAEKLFKATGVQVNEQIVNALLPSSERLRELRDEFIPMAVERRWAIHSFQEQYGVRLLGGKKVSYATNVYISPLW